MCMEFLQDLRRCCDNFETQLLAARCLAAEEEDRQRDHEAQQRARQLAADQEARVRARRPSPSRPARRPSPSRPARRPSPSRPPVARSRVMSPEPRRPPSRSTRRRIEEHRDLSLRAARQMIPEACEGHDPPDEESQAFAEEKAENVEFPLASLPPEVICGFFHKGQKRFFVYCTVCRCYPCCVKFNKQHAIVKGEWGFCRHIDGEWFQKVCLDAIGGRL